MARMRTSTVVLGCQSEKRPSFLIPYLRYWRILQLPPEEKSCKEGDSKDIQTLKELNKEKTNNWKSVESQIHDHCITDILERHEKIYKTFKQKLKSKQNTIGNNKNMGNSIKINTELDAKNLQNDLKHMSMHLSDDALECAYTIHALLFSEDHKEFDNVEHLSIKYIKQYTQLKKLSTKTKDQQISDINQRYTCAYELKKNP